MDVLFRLNLPTIQLLNLYPASLVSISREILPPTKCKLPIDEAKSSPMEIRAKNRTQINPGSEGEGNYSPLTLFSCLLNSSSPHSNTFLSLTLLILTISHLICKVDLWCTVTDNSHVDVLSIDIKWVSLSPVKLTYKHLVISNLHFSGNCGIALTLNIQTFRWKKCVKVLEQRSIYSIWRCSYLWPLK